MKSSNSYINQQNNVLSTFIYEYFNQISPLVQASTIQIQKAFDCLHSFMLSILSEQSINLNSTDVISLGILFAQNPNILTSFTNILNKTEVPNRAVDIYVFCNELNTLVSTIFDRNMINKFDIESKLSKSLNNLETDLECINIKHEQTSLPQNTKCNSSGR